MADAPPRVLSLMADAPPRVLSLLSAATEIVHRLGCSHLLVGRSHGCDDPPLAKVLPIATAPRVDPNAPSAVLDAAAVTGAAGAVSSSAVPLPFRPFSSKGPSC